MGIFDAMTAAVSGLQAQAFAIQNISGNIANSQTVAYKGIGTSSRISSRPPRCRRCSRRAA